jgi:hypothetical protein
MKLFMYVWMEKYTGIRFFNNEESYVYFSSLGSAKDSGDNRNKHFV